MKSRFFPISALGLMMLTTGGPAQQPARPAAPANANPEINGKTLDQWIREIEAPDPSVREQAIKTVALLGPQAKRAAPALIRQLQIPNDLSPMTNAAIALGLIVPDDPKHVKDAVIGLTNLLSSSQGIIRLQAATALGNLGAPARTAVPRLTRLMQDRESWEIRRAAAMALGRLGYDDKNMPDLKALTALIDGVDDLSKEVRIECLQGIINLGPPTNEAERLQLKQLLEKRVRMDKDKYAAIWLRVALMRVDSTAINDANLSFIAKHMKLNDPAGINADAARALGAIGSPASKKVGDLIVALQDKDVSLVAWAAWALGRMGQDARGALPALNTLLESADSSVRAAAADAIKQINNPQRRG